MSEARAIREAVVSERLLNARRTHLVRFIALAFFGALFLVLGVFLDDPNWKTNPWALITWLGFSAAVFFATRLGERVGVWLTLAPAFIDMPLVYVVQRAQYESTPSPSGVAGFSMGLFALLLGIASLSTARWQIYVTAASAAFWEVMLQAEAGVSVGARVSAVVVLALIASVLAYASGRRTELLIRTSRSQKLAALGQLSAAVGHDLRNPLAAVANAVFVLRRRLEKAGALTDTILEPLSLAEREVTASRRIVTDILDYTREGPLEKTQVELKPLLEECVSLVRVPETTKVTLEVDGAAVDASRDKLRQVFVNLIQNAVEAIPSGRAGVVKVEARVENAQVLVHVRDDGAGMDEATRARVFEPLFTTKKEGTGLGLAIVESLVKQHGGTLTLESVVGKGTTFTVLLNSAPQGDRTNF
ncbi:MAG: ATP-binding protein [Archangium sp.]